MTECTGQFTRSMGLPYRHTLKSMQDLSLKLTAGHFHAFWAFNHSRDEPFLRPPPEPQAPVYREPHVVRTKGRPRQTDGTTRREPSGWELRPPASSFRPFLPPERATASSAAVNTPPPPPPTPTADDDDEFISSLSQSYSASLRFPPSILRRKIHRLHKLHMAHRAKRWKMDSYPWMGSGFRRWRISCSRRGFKASRPRTPSRA